MGNSIKTALKRFNGTGWEFVGLSGFADIILRENEQESVEQSFIKIENTLPKKVNGEFTLYKDLTALGLGSGSSPVKIIGAMQDASMAVIGITGVTTVDNAWPSSNGTFFAIRLSQELAMAFYQPVDKNSLYTGGYYKSVSTAQETWTGWKTYSDVLAYDDTPTASSDNLVKSGVVYTAIEAAKDALSKKDVELKTGLDDMQKSLSDHIKDMTAHITAEERAAWNAKQDALTFDDTPTEGSQNPVTSAGTKSALNNKANANHNHDKVYVKQTSVGSADGVAPLGSDQKIPAQYLPSYVDDVIEGTLVNTTTFNGTDGSPVTPEDGKLYIDTAKNKTYRWSGTVYAEVGGGVALGETSETAYRGDRGKIAYDHSQTATKRTDGTANQTITNGGTFQAVSAVTDNNGHVTGVTLKTFTMPTISGGAAFTTSSSQPSNQKEGDFWCQPI